MKRTICSIYVITICLILIACSRTGNEAIDSSSTTSNSEQKPSAYDIIERENSFIITVYDEDRLPFEELGPFSKEPEVVWINEEIIRVSVQAGTGKETKWGIFYDLAEHRQSNTFYGILAETADIVVYCGDGCIIIQNIFDAEKFYQEINSFPKELAPAAAPFVSASISNDGKTVEIDYLSGSDFHTETVRVPLS